MGKWDFLPLLLFCLILIGCLAAEVSIVIALLAGLILFLIVGRRKGFSGKALFRMCCSGVHTAGGILTSFFLIGVLTAMWRASGCIPTIVSYAAGLITPSIFIMLTFLLNAMVSVLTGTAFGTAATMGVICVSIANSMGLPVAWAGGAMLSGAYLGDRWSPVSTSALLVSTVTKTDIYVNLSKMLRSSLLPLVLACGIYAAAGYCYGGGPASADLTALFQKEFHIQWICLLPATAILVLALFRVKIKVLLSVSILIALPIALWIQKVPGTELLRASLLGYRALHPELEGMISGGGILSMLRPAGIVCIASCYSGIFKETDMLGFLHKAVGRLGKHLGTFSVMTFVSTLLAMISCNQTLTIMLTDQLLTQLDEDAQERAVHLEDTAVVIAPLVPWSIAGAVPLATVGAPTISLLAACYLYLLPLTGILKELVLTADPGDQAP